MEYKYDLAISFAGEQRNLAEIFARRLDASGYSIFYDEFQQAELWGRDLSVALGNVYSREARYCLIILSTDYVAKPWTNHERQNAISEFLQRRSVLVGTFESWASKERRAATTHRGWTTNGALVRFW